MLQRHEPPQTPAEPQAADEPEVAAFTAFLGQLFTHLETSLTRYAARVHRDKGSVSRFFTGRRIAPKDFVDELLDQVADLTGNPVTDDVRTHAHHLRLEALRVRNAAQHELEQLRESLGAAERERHLAAVRERALLVALESAESRTRQAEQRYRQLEGDWATARYATGDVLPELYERPDGAQELQDEILGLKAEMEALRIELSRAQALKHAAEEQCLRLEARLLAAEATLQTERAKARERTAATAAAELETADTVRLREAAERIGTTLDPDTTAGELCTELVPAFADFAAVDLLDHALRDLGLAPDGPRPRADHLLLHRRHATSHHPPGADSPQTGTPIEGLLDPVPLSSPLGRAIAEGRPHTHPSEGPVSDAASADLGAAGRMLSLPLAARGTVMGRLLLDRLPHRPPFTDREIRTLADLAVRAATALNAALLDSARHRAARNLHRATLPQEPPAVPGIRIAHRYRPSTETTDSGSDWFDAVQLPGCRTALVVGDVMGRGLEATAAMGRYRAAVHALAALDLPPGQVLRHLDNLTHRFRDTHLATCLYAVYDPIERTLITASAGHLPPLLVHPDGTTEFLASDSNTPISMGGTPFTTIRRQVADGSTLLLYTDGLVEDRARDLDDGLADLRDVIAGAPPSPDALCDHLLDTLVPDGRDDDVAVVAASLDGIQRADTEAWNVEPRPEAVRHTRARVAEQLGIWEVDFLADDAALLVSELVTNALAYSREEVHVRMVRADRLLVEVTDQNHELPLDDRHDSGMGDHGWGIKVVGALASRWGTARRAVGKTVWFELDWPTGDTQRTDRHRVVKSLHD